MGGWWGRHWCGLLTERNHNSRLANPEALGSTSRENKVVRKAEGRYNRCDMFLPCIDNPTLPFVGFSIPSSFFFFFFLSLFQTRNLSWAEVPVASGCMLARRQTSKRARRALRYLFNPQNGDGTGLQIEFLPRRLCISRELSCIDNFRTESNLQASKVTKPKDQCNECVKGSERSRSGGKRRPNSV